ncbi:hypothetical protein TYM08_P0299 [Marinicellulosiphila megalodicopiae]
MSAKNKPKLRARTDDEKAQRKQSIVDALAFLLNDSEQVPSAMDIAKQANVSKGVIYQYFSSREEIFLTLLMQLSEPIELLSKNPIEKIEDIQKVIIDYFCENPLFMRLSIMAPIVLEENINENFIRQFKIAAGEIIDELAKLIMPICKQDILHCRNFINSFYQLSLMKWQYCHPPQSVKNAFKDHDFWLTRFDLETELNLAFDWLYKGMISSLKSTE